jgi:ubiquinone/menaquinone biosynthesis C-methylase UbiE
VIAVEPSAAMRARSACPAMIGGDAQALPLGPATMDGAWLSTVVHYLPDLPAAACELARVLRPGAPVLIRSAFACRCQRIGLTRFWPETAAVLDTFPISDAAYQAGLARLHAAAVTDSGPVTDCLGLLILHNTAPGQAPRQ